MEKSLKEEFIKLQEYRVSDELKEYNELKLQVESQEFQTEKKRICLWRIRAFDGRPKWRFQHRNSNRLSKKRSVYRH